MSDSYDYDLVCIGSGPAGQRAAVQAAKLGHRAAVVEKRRAVGGVCIDTGTIPSNTLREAVVTFSGLAGKGDRLPWAKLDRFGEAVESIEVADGPPRKAVLHLESGKRIVTDMALYSAGRIPATDSLNLLNAGIAADNRGRMTVDDCFRTAAPNISVFNYPTLAECYKVAALDASNKLRY